MKIHWYHYLNVYGPSVFNRVLSSKYFVCLYFTSVIRILSKHSTPRFQLKQIFLNVYQLKKRSLIFFKFVRSLFILKWIMTGHLIRNGPYHVCWLLYGSSWTRIIVSCIDRLHPVHVINQYSKKVISSWIRVALCRSPRLLTIALHTRGVF